jgi:hypothetical protein
MTDDGDGGSWAIQVDDGGGWQDIYLGLEEAAARKLARQMQHDVPWEQYRAVRVLGLT